MNQLFTDGGVVHHNPSPIGGTWAIRLLSDGVVEKELSGFTSSDEPTTNNFTEMLALVIGLQYLPTDWIGEICSDSMITIGRATLGWKWNNIPDWLRQDFEIEKLRLSNFDKLIWTLVKGHPTKKELADGVSKNGIPVSENNCWCDEECSKRAKEHM